MKLCFGRNIDGNDYVVGDIHGCFSKLEEQLSVIGFDEDKDRLFSVGDLVDRGPESERVVEWIEKPWFHPVRGNHEQMLINFFEEKNMALQYAYNGGKWFIDLDEDSQRAIYEVVKELPYAIEVDTMIGLVGIVHAEVPLHLWATTGERLHGRNREILLWSRAKINGGDNRRVHGVEKVYVGHTPVKERELIGNVHYIDTGAVFKDGKFTIENILGPD